MHVSMYSDTSLSAALLKKKILAEVYLDEKSVHRYDQFITTAKQELVSV